MSRLVIGLDLSLNHIGGVCFYNNSSDYSDVKWAYISNTKKEINIKTSSVYTKYLPSRITNKKLDTYEDIDNYGVFRLSYLKRLIYDMLLHFCELSTSDSDDIYFAIEGYSYGSKSNSTYQIGELGGVVRDICYLFGCIRIHDPYSIKLWATNKGNAKKRAMYNAYTKYSVCLDDIHKLIEEGKDDLKGVGTDVIDAFWLADLLRVELDIRDGTLQLTDLSEGQRQVFLRTTKTYPINMLNRPFIKYRDAICK